MYIVILFGILLFILYVLKNKGYEHCLCPECAHLNLHIKNFDRINIIKGSAILMIFIGILIKIPLFYFIPLLLLILYFDIKGKKINKSCTKCNFIL